VFLGVRMLCSSAAARGADPFGESIFARIRATSSRHRTTTHLLCSLVEFMRLVPMRTSKHAYSRVLREKEMLGCFDTGPWPQTSSSNSQVFEPPAPAGHDVKFYEPPPIRAQCRILQPKLCQFPLKALHSLNPPNRETQITHSNLKFLIWWILGV